MGISKIYPNAGLIWSSMNYLQIAHNLPIKAKGSKLPVYTIIPQINKFWPSEKLSTWFLTLALGPTPPWFFDRLKSLFHEYYRNSESLMLRSLEVGALVSSSVFTRDKITKTIPNNKVIGICIKRQKKIHTGLFWLTFPTPKQLRNISKNKLLGIEKWN